jgi:hypothetical protein
MSIVRVHNFPISLDSFGTGEPQSHAFALLLEAARRVPAERPDLRVGAQS